MSKPVHCIMLIDDNKIDNFFHERVVRKNEGAAVIIQKQSAPEALNHLKEGNTLPNIIFLDVNMPGMSGWEFIGEYKSLDIAHKCLIVVMISDYNDPEDEALEAVKGIFYDFRPKPVTREILEEVLQKYHAAI